MHINSFLNLTASLRIMPDDVVAYDYNPVKPNPDIEIVFDKVHTRKVLTVYMRGGHVFHTTDTEYINRFIGHFEGERDLPFDL